MEKDKMIVIGEKESFISRVLISKIAATGAECSFVHWTVDEICGALDGVSLVALYMENEERPEGDILHYLTDTLEEKSLQMILIGERQDIQYVCDNIPGDLIYAVFSRPVDNTKFAETVTEYFSKRSSGVFRKSILIVDDDPQYLTLVRAWLKETYKVSMANSGLQAIKWLGNNKVDLILLDHEMPVTSGPQVLEMLRNDPETQSIPVMFLTGKGDKESVMAVVALKPEGYFLKSIQKDELLEKLQEYFTLHK
ncbi:MAG: response regulator [Lachnospiraceae bacterium]|nr:response regulator [Lachnospiraceae bacterium]